MWRRGKRENEQETHTKEGCRPHRARIVGVEALVVLLWDGRGWVGHVPIFWL